MVIAEINIIPLGTARPGVGEYIADAIRVLRETGADFEVTAMGTIVQGELEAILEVARRMHEVPFAQGVLRVVTTIKIDDRRDRQATGADKVEMVKRRLARDSATERRT
jgi:uncharacterized protein (TIGR00106 family)